MDSDLDTIYVDASLALVAALRRIAVPDDSRGGALSRVIAARVIAEALRNRIHDNASIIEVAETLATLRKTLLSD